MQAVEERSIVEPGLPAKEEKEDLSLFKPDPTQVAVKNPFLSGEKPQEGARPGRVLAVPAARKLARELGIPIEEVPGSGPLGRVRVEDVRAYAERRKAPPERPEEGPQVLPAGFPPPPKYAPPKGYEHLEERVPLRGIRRTIAQGLWQSHLYTVRTLNVDEADLTELVRLRERLKPQAEAQGVKLTYLPFIVKAVVRALKKFPMLNTSLDEERQEIVYKRYYHIGLAVATERGLIVPVVRDADRKSVLELAQEIAELSQKAREGRLAPEEVTGSTFTITNIGSVGATLSFPIIHLPDAAILGVHSIRKRPWVMPDGSIRPRDIMFLSSPLTTAWWTGPRRPCSPGRSSGSWKTPTCSFWKCRMTPMKTYDLIVIGTGPGGYHAAIRAAQLGLKVLAVEAGEVGGLPQRGLHPHQGPPPRRRDPPPPEGGRGVRPEGQAGAGPEEARRLAGSGGEKLTGGVGTLLKGNGVELLRGFARLVGPKEVEVGGERYGAKA